MSLGCRVKHLEQTVFGSLDPTYPKTPNTSPNEDEEMHSGLLGTVQSLVEKVNAMESSIEELREVDLLVKSTSTYLSAMARTYKSETSTVKELLVLAAENDTLASSKDWLAYRALIKHLDQDWMKEIPAMSERLNRLAGIHIQQVERTALMQSRLHHMLRLYNDLVVLLNRRIISWDRSSAPS